jgi:hypothetical protein
MRTQREYADELRRRIERRNINGIQIAAYVEYVMEEFIDLAAEALAEMRADLAKSEQN